MSMSGMLPSVQNRTAEFRSCVASLSRISSSTAGSQRRNLAQDVNQNGGKQVSRGSFARNAAAISRDITDVMGKLHRLATLAKRKTLFDDRPVEISELTFVIKQDLAKINQQISSLQTTVKDNKKADGQAKRHSENVVILLQEKLTDVTSNFREVLEIRTKNIQASKSRTENFLSSSTASARGAPPPEKGSALYQAGRTETSASENPYALSVQESDSRNDQDDYLSLPTQEQSFMLLEEQQDQYIRERSTAIEAIESTINELGGIFSQLANMVAEQREVIQRIDANTEDVSTNISGAQRELLKYYATVSSNRWLFAKIFGIIIIFFLLFVLVS